jgi:hypothetical protein
MSGNANPFSTRLVAGVVLGGVIAFLGFLFLMAYAPQIKLRSGEGTTPLSRSAVGFYGLSKLAEATGRPVDTHGSRDDWARTGLVIVTVQPDSDPEVLKELADIRRDTEGAITLYILPKWVTFPIPTNRRWVQSAGTIGVGGIKAQLKAIDSALTVAEVRAPRGARVRATGYEMAGVDVAQPQDSAHLTAGVNAVLSDTSGRTILGRLADTGDSRSYVLADPDLLANKGLKTPEGARAALTIVDALRRDAEDSVAFDLALAGGTGGKRNLLQLMFEPPFLALTLAVLAAALLVGIHAFGRFGPPVPEPRAIPFGKRALADNAAILIGRAGAARRLGDRYVAIVRDAVAGALGAGHLTADEQEAWLARLPANGPDFATLAADARGAQNSQGMRAAAAALHTWRNEVTRDR